MVDPTRSSELVLATYGLLACPFETPNVVQSSSVESLTAVSSQGDQPAF